MPTQWWVLLGALAIATAWGVLHRYRQGRITRAASTSPAAAGAPGAEPATGRAAEPAGAGLPDPIRTAVFGTRPDGGSSPDGGAAPDAAGAGAEVPAGADVVLLQLSTTFCAPCRHAGVILADLAERTPGLRHVEYDLTSTPEVAAALRVLKTPTTLVLDAGGRELFRVHGVPRRDRLAAELEPHLGARD